MNRNRTPNRTCPRCNDQVMPGRYAGDPDGCLACGWEDYSGYTDRSPLGVTSSTDIVRVSLRLAPRSYSIS